jgi:hypothetical protein
MSTISTGHAKKLIKNFVDFKIGTTISPLDTRGVWFSREVLESQLNTPVATEMGDVLPSGLRFYFAAYEEYNPTEKNPPEHELDAQKVTLVIIPTARKLDANGNVIMHPYRKNEHLPFDLVTDPEAVPAYDKNLFTNANDGQLCPPPKTII